MGGKSIVLDTNLLILLIVGLASPEYINQHKRTNTYTEDDYSLLLSIVSEFSKIVLLPNTLSETSNLIGQFKSEPARSHIFKTFHTIIFTWGEIYVESRHGAQRVEFARLGLTDSVLLHVISSEHTLLTDDLDLYREAAKNGYEVINFNHHR